MTDTTAFDYQWRQPVDGIGCDACMCCRARDCHRGPGGCYDPDHAYCPCTED